MPAVFSIGYSNGHLAQDPNLAEGLPVVDQPYRRQEPCRRGHARSGHRRRPAGAVAQRGWRPCSTRSRSPRFATAASKRPAATGSSASRFRTTRASATFADRSVVHGGRVSCRLEPGAKDQGHTSPNVRLVQRVEPCVRIPPIASRAGSRPRTSAPTGSFQLLALGTSQAGRSLTFHEGGLEPTQDWKRVDVVFNSLDRTRGQPLRRVLGRGKGHVLGRRPCARRAGAGQRPAAQGMPVHRQVGRRQDDLRGRPRLRAGRRPQARPGPLAGRISSSTIPAPRSASRRARGSRPATGCA